MKLLLRIFYLRLLYWITKLKHLGRVRFNGFTVIYAFPGSVIDFEGKGIVINSHPLSNLVGIEQRTILVARHGGAITIGENAGISGATIYAMERITIGNEVLIGANCKIIDNDFHPLRAELRNPQKVEDIKKRPIVIGDGCFIGANSIILKGTTLGRNCVVGAGSVVCGTFPDSVIIAGNPAKVVKQNL